MHELFTTEFPLFVWVDDDDGVESRGVTHIGTKRFTDYTVPSTFSSLLNQNATESPLTFGTLHLGHSSVSSLLDLNRRGTSL